MSTKDEITKFRELGAVDVLAGAKREKFRSMSEALQVARTIAEIAEICHRFRGEAKVIRTSM